MIIAFTGGVGSGKDTAARHLTKTGKAFTRVNFDTPLKEIQERAYAQLLPVYRRKPGFTQDSALISLLSSWGKTLSPTLWTDLWRDRVEFEQRVYDIVCSDCFFDNQAYAIRALGGHVINIMRPDCAASFVDKLKVDFTIDNNTSLEVFYERIDKVLAQINEMQQSKVRSITNGV